MLTNHKLDKRLVPSSKKLTKLGYPPRQEYTIRKLPNGSLKCYDTINGPSCTFTR